ncbi:hypothetical protein CONPUDRAFT_41795, partial [Coniophora puteana RWD-64-598 SS2]
LAYMHWYRPFQTIDPSTSMFKLERSTCLHGPHASVVPVSHILWSCHLIPYRAGEDGSLW